MTLQSEPDPGAQFPLARRRLSSLLADALRHLPGDHERSQTSLREAILMVQGPPETRCIGGLATWQMRRVETFVRENLGGEVNLRGVAGLTRISVSHFSRAFKTSFGQSFTQYLIARRVERARDLLRDTDRSISDIALDCGLSDQSHLTRLFRRHYGAPPSAWRRAFGRVTIRPARRASPDVSEGAVETYTLG